MTCLRSLSCDGRHMSSAYRCQFNTLYREDADENSLLHFRICCPQNIQFFERYCKAENAVDTRNLTEPRCGDGYIPVCPLTVIHGKLNKIAQQMAVQHKMQPACKHQSIACMTSHNFLDRSTRSWLATLYFDFTQSM
ncbi:Hypothetical_protein [Hexamita inflata]|uniref:Hypothetical_protein n=1 Tax=Hexamita inflata TaxID=28002 RepID=A0AA86QCX7_9EUKA|nr:Hypothetical protein HINF_LOCUS38379 [Hexamita inflata]